MPDVAGEAFVTPEQIAALDLCMVTIEHQLEARDGERIDQRGGVLETAKEVILDFVARRKNDRIGVVVFGRTAYILSPPTLDKSLLSTLVSRGATVSIDRESGIRIVRGGVPPTDAQLTPALPGRLNFVLRWGSDANLDLGVSTPATAGGRARDSAKRTVRQRCESFMAPSGALSAILPWLISVT